MESRIASRRSFLLTSLRTVASTAVLGSVALPRVVEGRQKICLPIRLGGPAFANTQDPEELALAHRKLGYSAAYCPNVPLNDTAKIRAYADAFAKHDVVIAEVG